MLAYPMLHESHDPAGMYMEDVATEEPDNSVSSLDCLLLLARASHDVDLGVITVNPEIGSHLEEIPGHTKELISVESNELRGLLPRLVVQDVVSDAQFEMLPGDRQDQLVRLLPESDREEECLSDTAISNEFVVRACEELQCLLNNIPFSHISKKVTNKRQLHVWPRPDSESSIVSSASHGTYFSDSSNVDGSPPKQLNKLHFLARAAAVAAAEVSSEHEVGKEYGHTSQASAGSTSKDNTVTRRKRGARKNSRSEAASTLTSARTEGLKSGERSGTPARLTGSSVLLKIPASAKVGHLRSRYSSAAPFFEVCPPESPNGDTHLVMSSGFDHDYSSVGLQESSFGCIPIASRGFATEHDYARSSDSPGGRAMPGKRHSLGDLSNLHSMNLSVSSLMPGRDPLAIAMSSPIELNTIEDANLAPQLASRESSSLPSHQVAQQQDGPSLALNMLAATANLFVGSPGSFPAPVRSSTEES